jgi:hypothetical protein
MVGRSLVFVGCSKEYLSDDVIRCLEGLEVMPLNADVFAGEGSIESDVIEGLPLNPPALPDLPCS